MRCRLAYRSYQQSLQRPLQTAKDCWHDRQGIIVQLRTDNATAYGEIAPAVSHGSESLAQAQTWLKRYDHDCALDLGAAPEALPATHTAVQWALLGLTLQQSQVATLEAPVIQNTVLLPAGHEAIAVAKRFSNDSYTTYKWKIGQLPLAQERAIAHQLAETLPTDSQLRLDANGRLDLATTEAWLQLMDSLPIAFIEQPLPPTEEHTLFALARAYPQRLALDESVGPWPAVERLAQRQWPGFLVIKPSLLGDLKAFLRWRTATAPQNLIYSSIFESAVGIDMVMALIAADPYASDKAHGLGTLGYWVESPLSLHPLRHCYWATPRLSTKQLERLWHHLQ